MDSKLTTSKTTYLSGTNILVVLGTLLIVAAIGLDLNAGRLTNFNPSLTIPLVISAVATAVIGYVAVPILQKLKTGQIIREDGPQSHLKKAGTPTMGGIFVVPVGIAIALLGSGFSPQVIAISTLTLAYGIIGWIDDWQILVRKSNKGISPRLKLGLQIGFAGLFCLWLSWSQPESITNIDLPMGLSLPLGWFFWIFAGFLLVAESNATNLTDGLDGLAGGLGAIALFGLGALIAPSSPELMIFCASLSGSYLGFLTHNRNPALVFMGDTGSLALGGALAGVALLSNSIWSLFLVSGIFFVETISVIAQVSYYKATKGPDGVGKRLLRMAPLHHHLELSGWTEIKIVAVFYLINGVLDLVSFSIH